MNLSLWQSELIAQHSIFFCILSKIQIRLDGLVLRKIEQSEQQA